MAQPFLPFRTPLLIYTVSQRGTQSKRDSPAATCPSGRDLPGLGGPTVTQLSPPPPRPLMASPAFLAGLDPDALVSPEQKRLLPSLWVLVSAASFTADTRTCPNVSMCLGRLPHSNLGT